MPCIVQLAVDFPRVKLLNRLAFEQDLSKPSLAPKLERLGFMKYIEFEMRSVKGCEASSTQQQITRLLEQFLVEGLVVKFRYIYI